MTSDTSSARQGAIPPPTFDLQKTQHELHQRFNANLQLFSKAAPELFNEFRQFTPENFQIRFAPEGYINLYSSKSMRMVYPCHPLEFATRQIQEFQNKPVCLRLNFIKSDISNHSYIHPALVNRLIDYYQSNTSPETKLDLVEPAGVIIVIGTGFGHHIEAIVDQYDFRHLTIMEPSKDSFYASLHTADWTKIVSKTTQKGRSIQILVGKSDQESFLALRQLPDSIGLHNVANTFLFQHLESSRANTLRNIIVKNYHQMAVGVGFFDDEKISLTHTIKNTEKTFKLLSSSPPPQQNSPAVVIGNGPSLDRLVDTLKSIKDKVVIFSCGTALGALYKSGIKPDYHVELERTKNIYDWICLGSDEPFRKGITLLTLNTCPPDVTRLFDTTIYAKKANDTGSSYLDTLDQSVCNTEPLAHCNPTVSNCALSFAIRMGFNNITLFGVDLGVTNHEEHHSKLSLYQQVENNFKINPLLPPWKAITNPLKRSAIKVRGNFTDEVLTTTILDTCRSNMEQLLNGQPNVTCYNPNHGAYIAHTQRGKPDYTKFGKKHINETFFSEYKMNSSKQLNAVKKQTRELLKKIKLQKNLVIEKPLSELNRVQYHLNDAETSLPIAHKLLKGSINTYLGIMYRYSEYQENKSTLLGTGIDTYHEFLESARKLINTQLLNEDDTKNIDLLTIKSNHNPRKTNVKLFHSPKKCTSSELETTGIAGPFQVADPQLVLNAMETMDKLTQPGDNINPHIKHESFKAILRDKHLHAFLKPILGDQVNFKYSFIQWRHGASAKPNWHNAQTEDSDYTLLIGLTDFDDDTGRFQVIPCSHRKTITGVIETGEAGNLHFFDVTGVKSSEIFELELKTGFAYLLANRLLKVAPTVSKGRRAISLSATVAITNPK